jgi:hypothetical protein
MCAMQSFGQLVWFWFPRTIQTYALRLSLSMRLLHMCPESVFPISYIRVLVSRGDRTSVEVNERMKGRRTQFVQEYTVRKMTIRCTGNMLLTVNG